MIFNRYAALFFGVVSLFNCLVMIPIYATGDPSDPALLRDESSRQVIQLLLITIANATGNSAKVAAAFIMNTALYTTACLIFIYFYWKRSLSWRFHDLPKEAKFREADVALHAIWVTNIPENEPAHSATQRLLHIFETIFGAEKVVAARVLPKYDDLYDKALKLKTYRKRAAFYRH